MAAFKEGDWVRMTETDYNGGYKSGDAFRLIGVSEKGVRFTDNDGDPRYADQDSGRFEPWTPKVGERVRFTEECSGNYWFFGPDTEVTHGVVAEDDRSSSYRFQVDTSKGCAFVNVRHIEPLPVAAEAQPVLFNVGDVVVGTLNPIEYVVMNVRANGNLDVRSVKGWQTYYDEPARVFRLRSDTTATTTNTAATVDALDEEYGPGMRKERPWDRYRDVVADRDNDTVGLTVSLDTSELHEELDAVIAKLKKIRKLQRELGLIAA